MPWHQKAEEQRNKSILMEFPMMTYNSYLIIVDVRCNLLKPPLVQV